jgi:hypothetical protein
MKSPRLSLTRPDAILPSPPRDLGAPGRDLWRRIHAEYRLEDAGSIECLAQICEAASRIASLSAMINEDGAILRSGKIIRSHPALREELANRSFVTKSLRALGVALEPLNSTPGVQPIGRNSGVRFLPTRDVSE